MDEMKLRGYAVPEDFSGSDAERIQAALDCAAEKDIRKVILKGNYVIDSTVYIPEHTHLVFDGCRIKSAAKSPIFTNFGFIGKDHQYCFQDDLFYLEGRNGAEVEGDFFFYNAYRIVFDKMNIKGVIRFEFSREIRFEDDTIEGENAVIFARGCNNVIMERVHAKTTGTAVVLDSGLCLTSDYCIGKEDDLHDMILKDGEFDAPAAFSVDAEDGHPVFNIFIEDNAANSVGAVIGAARAVHPSVIRDVTAVGFTGASTAVDARCDVFHGYLS